MTALRRAVGYAPVGRPRLYPFPELTVGDIMIVTARASSRATIRAAASQFARDHHPGFRGAIRRVGPTLTFTRLADRRGTSKET